MSKIEWTGETWNPIIGCDKVSPGCKNCYAIQTAWIRQHNAKMAEKYAGVVEKTAGGQLNWTGKVNMHEPSLLKPVMQKKPTTYFVNSMSDLFHESIPFSFIDKIFAIMALTPQHTYQVLTKRARRMLEYFACREDSEMFSREADLIVYSNPELFFEKEWYKDQNGKTFSAIGNELLPSLKEASWYQDKTYTEYGNDVELIYEGQCPLPNVWIGVSVEDQNAADERIPLLLQVSAAVRFLSCEPLLSEVIIFQEQEGLLRGPGVIVSGGVTSNTSDFPAEGYDDSYPGIDWIICGGESGKGARPMHPDWARSLRDQCKEAGVAFFFKQWGENAPGEEHVAGAKFNDTGIRVPYEANAVEFAKVGKKKAGRLLDGRIHDAMPYDSKT